MIYSTAHAAGPPPFGYLVTALFVTLATLSCLAPYRVRFLGYARSYLAYVNELPFIVILWLLISTYLAISQGGIGSIVGLVALTLSLFSIGGLIVVILRATTTSKVIRIALVKGLGQKWRTSIGEKSTARLKKAAIIPAVFGPIFIRRWGVKRVANIAYGDVERKNMLDVYYRSASSVSRPVFIYFHGGAMKGGSKNYQGLPLLYQLASHGWMCISANYRLSPSATFPEHLIDVKKVIAWARSHANEYGANPELLCIAGSSSGGQLATLAALTPSDSELQPGFEHIDTSVLGAVSLYGDYDWLDSPNRVSYLAQVMKSTPASNPKAWANASPITHIRKDAPPFFVLHGDNDTTLPVGNARRFAKALRNVSHNPVVYAELPYAQHIFDMFRSIRADAVNNGIEAFLDWVISQKKYQKSR